MPSYMIAELPGLTPGITPKTVGKRVKITREALGLSQEAFGRPAGMTKSAISNIENGRNYPTLLNVANLVEAHDLTLAWIVTGSTKGMRHELLDAIRALMTVRAGKPEPPEPPQPSRPRGRAKVA
jgi:transcriptional regulator with XRE-family HTH domain